MENVCLWQSFDERRASQKNLHHDMYVQELTRQPGDHAPLYTGRGSRRQCKREGVYVVYTLMYVCGKAHSLTHTLIHTPLRKDFWCTKMTLLQTLTQRHTWYGKRQRPQVSLSLSLSISLTHTNTLSLSLCLSFSVRTLSLSPSIPLFIPVYNEFFIL